MKRLLLAALAVALLTALPGGAQLANSECDDAAVYHLQAALDYRLRDDQSYHLGAADAANQLTDPDCEGWQAYSNAPSLTADPPGSAQTFQPLGDM